MNLLAIVRERLDFSDSIVIGPYTLCRDKWGEGVKLELHPTTFRSLCAYLRKNPVRVYGTAWGAIARMTSEALNG